MKKLITSLILSTALVGGVCATAGCTSSSTADKGGNQTASDTISVADGINSSNELYSYGAASIGSIISASAADAATAQKIMSTLQNVTITETPVEGEEEQPTETPVEGEEETPVEPEVPAEPETPVEPEVPETPAEPEAPVEPETPAEPEVPPVAPEAPSSELTEEQLATVNSYMALVENLLANGGLSAIRTESDREGYEIREEVSFSDLAGNVISYVMYYNSTLDYTEIDDDETESRYSISGVMVIDGVDYALEGYTETETSEKENESEAYFKVTLADGSYIVMEQEVEDDETSLVFKVVEDKKVVEKIKFEYETEHGETELKMCVEKDGVKTELKFKEVTEQDKKVIKVTVTEGENKTTFKIEVTQDEEGNDVYHYTFGDKVKEMHKNHGEKGNRHDKFEDDKWQPEHDDDDHDGDHDDHDDHDDEDEDDDKKWRPNGNKPEKEVKPEGEKPVKPEKPVIPEMPEQQPTIEPEQPEEQPVIEEEQANEIINALEIAYGNEKGQSGEKGGFTWQVSEKLNGFEWQSMGKVGGKH